MSRTKLRIKVYLYLKPMIFPIKSLYLNKQRLSFYPGSSWELKPKTVN